MTNAKKMYLEDCPLPEDSFVPWNGNYEPSDLLKSADGYKVMIIDTETTGLDPRFNSLLQISWQVVQTETWKVLSRQNFYFKYPKNRDRISPKAIAVNGLTEDKIGSVKTSNIKEALYTLNKELGYCDLMVGHNIEFDLGFIKEADSYFSIIDHPIRTFCTKLNAVNLCKLPHRSIPGQYKYPRLSELADFLGINTDSLNLHDSTVDVELTKQCFIQLAKIEWWKE